MKRIFEVYLVWNSASLNSLLEDFSKKDIHAVATAFPYCVCSTYYFCVPGILHKILQLSHKRKLLQIFLLMKPAVQGRAEDLADGVWNDSDFFELKWTCSCAAWLDLCLCAVAQNLSSAGLPHVRICAELCHGLGGSGSLTFSWLLDSMAAADNCIALVWARPLLHLCVSKLTSSFQALLPCMMPTCCPPKLVERKVTCPARKWQSQLRPWPSGSRAHTIDLYAAWCGPDHESAWLLENVTPRQSPCAHHFWDVVGDQHENHLGCGCKGCSPSPVTALGSVRFPDWGLCQQPGPPAPLLPIFRNGTHLRNRQPGPIVSVLSLIILP